MGRKWKWFALWSDEWLSDLQVRMLPLGARGMYMDILSIIWAQGTRPGYLILKGYEDSLKTTSPDFDKTIMKVLSSFHAWSNKGRSYLDGMISGQLLVVSSDGYLYSPRIEQAWKESELKSKAGQARADRSQSHS